MTVKRIWDRGTQSMGPRVAAVIKSRADQRGRKRMDRAKICKRISEVPVEDRTNQLTLQLATNTSCYMIQQLIKEGFLQRSLKQTRPLLTLQHQLDRVKFCINHIERMPNGLLKKDFLLRHVGWLPDSLPCDELVYDEAMELLRKHDVSAVATPPPPPPQRDVHNDLEWLS